MHFTLHVAKYPIQVGILAIALPVAMAWLSKRPALGLVFFNLYPHFQGILFRFST